MKTKIGIALICWLWCLSLIGGTAAFAASTPEGDWFIAITGQKHGKARITIPADSYAGGSFNVEGAGYFYKPTTSFFRIAADQILSVNSRGIVTGSLELQDYSQTTSIGTLQITNGRFTKTYDKLVLAGRLTLDPATRPVKITLIGRPMPTSSAVLTGRTIQGGISGKGIFTKNFDLTVKEHEDDDQPDLSLGFPFYTVTGGGSINVGGKETFATLSGMMIIDPLQDNIKLANAFGSITGDLGDGSMQGSLYNTTGFPRLKLYLKTPNYYCTLGGNLDIATSPILSVDPPKTMLFEDVTIDATEDQDFTITNIGAGTLAGEVTITGEGFEIVGSDTDSIAYSIEAGQETIVTIRFSPTEQKTYNGTATFTGGGLVTRSLKGTVAAPTE